MSWLQASPCVYKHMHLSISRHIHHKSTQLNPNYWTSEATDIYHPKYQSSCFVIQSLCLRGISGYRMVYLHIVDGILWNIVDIRHRILPIWCSHALYPHSFYGFPHHWYNKPPRLHDPHRTAALGRVTTMFLLVMGVPPHPSHGWP